MTLWFQCASCKALHIDPDACNKCDHRFRTDWEQVLASRGYDVATALDVQRLVDKIFDLQQRRR